MDTQSKQDHFDDLFDQAVALPPSKRQEFLNAACNGDADVLEQVRKMVAAHEMAEQSTGVFATPPDDQRLFPNGVHRQHALVGQRIGPYQVIRWLGGGGFGHVYLAFRSDDYKQKVAVKVLRSDIDVDDRVLARFELERQLLADLQHEYIARLLYGGTLDTGRPYIVMEYVKGTPITEYCDAKRLAVPERLTVFRQVCEAVAYAHRYSAIHRDIKPGNILVTDDGTVKLLDFGIAKTVDPISQRRMVTISEGGMPLTPEYASPEQVRAEGISTASDVYSLGVVLYELLTGRRPYEFRRHTAAEYERVICEEEPRKPSTVVLEPIWIHRDDGTEEVRSAETLAELRSSDPQKLNRLFKGDLEQIILMALRKEPQRRYQTVEALIQDMDRYNSCRTILARPIGRPERARRWIKRNKMVALLSAVAILALLGGSVVSTLFALAFYRQADAALAAKEAAEAREAETSTLLDLVDTAHKFGVDHPDTLARTVDAANSLNSRGRGDAARRLLEATYADYISKLGPDDAKTLQSMKNLSDLYRKQGRIADAEKLDDRHLLENEKFYSGLAQAAKIGPDAINQLIDAADTHRAEDMPTPLDALVLGELQLLAGKPQSAEAAIRTAIQDGEAKPHSYKSLGWCLLAQGKVDDARQAFQVTLKNRVRKDGTYDLEKAGPDLMTAAYFLDLVTEQVYVKDFESDTRLACFPWFYVAQRREIEGKKDAAVTAYERCAQLGKGDNPHPVRALAEWRLRKLQESPQPDQK